MLQYNLATKLLSASENHGMVIYYLISQRCLFVAFQDFNDFI